MMDEWGYPPIDWSLLRVPYRYKLGLDDEGWWPPLSGERNEDGEVEP